MYDFDVIPLAVNNIGSIVPHLSQYLTGQQSGASNIPKIRKTKYIVDPTDGDGGVRWADGDIDNPNTRRDMYAYMYPEGSAFEIPFNANADGDLVTEYWPSVRTLIKNALTVK